MTQPPEQDYFDVENLRRRVSDVANKGSGDRDNRTKLNPLALQIARQFQEESHSPQMVIGQIRLAELVFLLVLHLMFFSVFSASGALHFAGKLGGAAVAAFITCLLLQLSDCYLASTLRKPSSMLIRIATSFAIGFLGIRLFFVIFHGNWPANFPESITWLSLGCLLLLTERYLIGYGIRNWTRNGLVERRAVIVGGGESAKNLIRDLERQADSDIRICGIFDDRSEKRSPEVLAGYPKLGTFAELVEFARLAHIDMLIISLPLSAEERIFSLLKKLWVLPVDIRLAAHAAKLRFRPRSYSRVGSVAMLDIFDRPIRDWDWVAKRVFDIVFSLIAIALLWPVMLGAAIAVKATSKGPILFRQKRHGFNNEEIDVLKFRSMYTEMCDPTAKIPVSKGDPRVTPVGRFIRKTSIDELPQFFNVLGGSLSLVGPRPHSVNAQSHSRIYDEVVDGYFARHRVKPGVTGWAQINGWRGEIDSDDKIRNRTAYDLYYIENWSLLFDLKILFLTPIRLMNTDSAY
jgi:Undecaprenyl-phosphate glucose phosphotransferase